MEIENKIALVTGGTGGIGSAIIQELLLNGAKHVAILDLDESKGEKYVEELNTKFGPNRAIFIVCDVSKPDQLEGAFERVLAEFGGLDIVVNNAGLLDEIDWELMMSINLYGVIRGSLLGFRYMGKKDGGKGGTIVNVSSILGVHQSASVPLYSATKHAIIGFSRSLGEPIHFSKSGVRLLTLCPGVTMTGFGSDKLKSVMGMLTEPEMKAEISDFSVQKAQNVGRAAISIIRAGKSGSVWVCEDENPAYEIKLPNPDDLSSLAIQDEQ